VGAALGLVRGFGWRPGPVVNAVVTTLGALVGTNGPMTALGVTDPRTWPLDSRVSHVMPHLGYGRLTAAVLNGL